MNEMDRFWRSFHREVLLGDNSTNFTACTRYKHFQWRLFDPRLPALRSPLKTAHTTTLVNWPPNSFY